jgi:uridine kinase
MNKPLFIGIAGGSASGKTTVASKICASYENHVTIIRQDDYYNDQTSMTMEERVLTNYDHPNAFDFDLMIENLTDLMEGNEIRKPIYDFVKHNRSDQIEIVKPTAIIILEGLFALENKDLRDLMDIKIYVHTDSDIRFIRRLLRDVNERGRTLDSVIKQYTDTVRPMHLQFINPTKREADVIIPEGGNNIVAIDLITTKINSILFGKTNI